MRSLVSAPVWVLRISGLLPAMIAYGLGLMSIRRIKTLFSRRFLAGMDAARLERAAERYAREVLPKITNAAAYERFQAHIAAGHRVVIVSANLELYIADWARHHGVEETLATRLEIRDGKLKGVASGSRLEVGP
jgi:HAD superfamily phosphoserine phosphatase-like hydrolase